MSFLLHLGFGLDVNLLNSLRASNIDIDVSFKNSELEKYSYLLFPKKNAKAPTFAKRTMIDRFCENTKGLNRKRLITDDLIFRQIEHCGNVTKL